MRISDETLEDIIRVEKAIERSRNERDLSRRKIEAAARAIARRYGNEAAWHEYRDDAAAAIAAADEVTR